MAKKKQSTRLKDWGDKNPNEFWRTYGGTTQKKARMKTKIVICVHGGCVQSVYSSDPNAEVKILDDDGDDHRADVAREAMDRLDKDKSLHPVL